MSASSKSCGNRCRTGAASSAPSCPPPGRRRTNRGWSRHHRLVSSASIRARSSRASRRRLSFSRLTASVSPPTTGPYPASRERSPKLEREGPGRRRRHHARDAVGIGGRRGDARAGREGGGEARVARGRGHAVVRLAVGVGDEGDRCSGRGGQLRASLAERTVQLVVGQGRQGVVTQRVEADAEPGLGQSPHVVRGHDALGRRRPDCLAQRGGDLCSLGRRESLDGAGEPADCSR